MHDPALRAQLESLHPESFGWALCCCRRDRHRAEDVLQKTYLKVLAGTAKFQSQGTFKTWLFGVIRLTALEDRRTAWRNILRLLAYQQDAREATTEPRVPTDGTQAAFQSALDALPPRQRETLHLVFYQDLSLAQAADVMGISVGSARQHYDRGKAALRQRLTALPAFKEFHDERQSGTTGHPKVVL